MCLKKNKLKELMEDYPDAMRFYMQRAWYRRMEFRRRMFKHQKKLIIASAAKSQKKGSRKPGGKHKKPAAEEAKGDN